MQNELNKELIYNQMNRLFQKKVLIYILYNGIENIPYIDENNLDEVTTVVLHASKELVNKKNEIEIIDLLKEHF